MDCKKIGKYIKDKRKALGYKQSDLGEMLSVSDKAVSKWECGVALPDVSLLPELSKILNVDISEILNGEDDPKVEEEIKNKNKSKICIITLSILSSILFILVIILGIYFINNYDRVHVYKLVGEKDDFRVEGRLISIGDKKYFIFSEVGFGSIKDYKSFDVDKIICEFYYKNILIHSKKEIECYNDCFDNRTITFYIEDNYDYSISEFFVLKVKFLKEENVVDETGFNLKIIE